MSGERILVIGSPGSGKSTMARRLSAVTGVAAVHLDQLWWKPGWVEESRTVFDARLSEILACESWIIDGNYSRTLPLRLSRATTVVYLDYPRYLCLFRVLRRILGGLGRVRADMAPGCPERLDGAFLRFVWSYRRKNAAKNDALLALFPGRCVRCRTPRDTEAYLDEVSSRFGGAGAVKSVGAEVQV